MAFVMVLTQSTLTIKRYILDFQLLDLTMTSATSRRSLIKLISAAPLLPLTSSWVHAGTAMVGAAAKTAGLSFKGVTFSHMAAPSLANAAAMATTSVASVMSVHYKDGTKEDMALAYEPFFLTGAQVPDGHGRTTLAGGYYNIRGQAIMDSSGATPRQYFSDSPDGTSLLKLDAKCTVPGITGNAVYAVVQFEYTTRNLHGDAMYGKLPSPIAVLTLDQHPQTGKLTLKKYAPVDTSTVHGLWITCGSSLSPWNTHLSSEEYPPDARNAASNTSFQAFIQNLYTDPNAASDARKANPYLYGHMPEVTVHPDGTGTVVKHYNMGRISHELVEVMPDHRTVLMGDDTTNGGYFMFIADKAKDLSAGTLYVAKLRTPLTSVEPGTPAVGLQWVQLGHATSAEIEALAATLDFGDIMDFSATDPLDSSYSKVYLNGAAQWVRVKPGMAKAAAFLETHRYAAIQGGAMGFTKMEGTTVNRADKVMYSALSACRDSMVAGHAKHDPLSQVNLPAALNAGTVMALHMKGGMKDHLGQPIASEWVPHNLATLLAGQDQKPDALGNTAHADKIANPDNLKFSEKMRTLFIGEDSGMHVNNFLWAYNVDTKSLTRVLSCPSGAECTGLHVEDALNGWTYIMSNFQHAGDWEKIHNIVKPTLDPLVRANYNDRYSSAVGYLTSQPKQMKLGK